MKPAGRISQWAATALAFLLVCGFAVAQAGPSRARLISAGVPSGWVYNGTHKRVRGAGGAILMVPHETNTAALFSFALADAGLSECGCADVPGVVVVRGSVAECISADGQSITQCAADKPRVMTGAVNRTVLGVASEQTARENLTKNSRDLSQAAWVASNMTCTRTASGMRGGDSNGASHCCATAANGTVKQTILTANGGEQVHSWHLRRSAGTGAVNLSIDGTTWLADIGGALSSSWKRAVPTETVGCTAVSGGASGCIVQAGLYGAPNPPVQSLRIVQSGDCVDVDFAQAERAANGVASTPIENPSTSYVTRASETVDLIVPPSLVFTSQYCSAATLVHSVPGAGSTPTIFPRFAGVLGDRDAGDLNGSDNFAQAYMNTSSFNEWVTSTTTLASPNSLATGLTPDAGTLIRTTHFWNGANLNSCIDGWCPNGQDNPPEGAPDSSPYTAATFTRHRLGGYTAANGAVDGVFSEVQDDPNAVACRRFQSIEPACFAASIGDSISCCPSANPGWVNGANQLYAAGSRMQIASLAKGGAYTGSGPGTINNCLYQWTNFVRGRRYGTLFVLCGINDILSGLNMTTALANLTQIWDEARADGLRLVVGTLTPAGGRVGWDATKQAQLETLNTAIRAYAAAHASDTALAELYTPDWDSGGLRVTDGGTAMDSRTGTADGLHPGPAGQARISALQYAASPSCPP